MLCETTSNDSETSGLPYLNDVQFKGFVETLSVGKYSVLVVMIEQ